MSNTQINLPVISTFPVSDFKLDIHRSKVNPKKIKIIKKTGTDLFRPNSIDPSQDLVYLSVRDEAPLYISKSIYMKNKENMSSLKKTFTKNLDTSNTPKSSAKTSYNDMIDSPSNSGSETPPLSPNSSILVQASLREENEKQEKQKNKIKNNKNDSPDSSPFSSSAETPPIEASKPRSRSATPEINFDNDGSQTPPLSPNLVTSFNNSNDLSSSIKNNNEIKSFLGENNSDFVLLLPSISTTSLQFDPKIASSIFSPIINQFLSQNDSTNFKIVLVDENKKVLKLLHKVNIIFNLFLFTFCYLFLFIFIYFYLFLFIFIYFYLFLFVYYF